MKMNNEFKVGDRVKAITEHDHNNAIVGKTGTIVSEYETYGGVEFDKPIDKGHDCNGDSKQGHGWDCGYDCLELIPKGKHGRKAKVDERKFVVYGTGCNNLSNVIIGLDNAKDRAKSLIEDSQWAGDIQIIELKPLYTLHKTTSYRFDDNTKVKKKPAKKASK